MTLVHFHLNGKIESSPKSCWIVKTIKTGPKEMSTIEMEREKKMRKVIVWKRAKMDGHVLFPISER